jgi:N-acetylglucosaminyldiphosphoundecaprenol N-acetyl-beta-D-mannosaminyltransferase
MNMRTPCCSNRQFDLLGAPISLVTMMTALAHIEGWIARKENRYICAADVHSIMRAKSDRVHRAAIHSADMVLPDGMPIVWAGRIRTAEPLSRVCGPDLMAQLCSHSAARFWRHFFLGGRPGVAERVASRLAANNPGLVVCGTASPPFRALTKNEDSEVVQGIIRARPDIVWVGLGCPKQERWMLEHIERIQGAVLIGVGAAFDIHAGQIKRAPRWMQLSGLEWLYRLISEPRRLWKRYLRAVPLFFVLALWETASLTFSRCFGAT